MLEEFFLCPHCFQRVSVLIDPSVPEQQCVEDCEVCCNPLTISYAIAAGEVVHFEAEPLGQ